MNNLRSIFWTHYFFERVIGAAETDRRLYSRSWLKISKCLRSARFNCGEIRKGFTKFERKLRIVFLDCKKIEMNSQLTIFSNYEMVEKTLHKIDTYGEEVMQNR